MSLFERKKLPLSASVEQASEAVEAREAVATLTCRIHQCCATGITPEGKTPKTLVEEMVPLLDDRSVRCVSVGQILCRESR